MTTYRANVIFHSTSGLPEDQVVNTWHFYKSAGGALASDGNAIAGALASAYTRDPDAAGADVGVDKWLSGTISRVTRPTVKVYEVDEVTGLSGSPISEDTFAGLAAPLTDPNNAPREIAICLSYHSDLEGVAESIPAGPVGPAGDDRPASRYRGRIYVGPFILDAVDVATGRPKATVMESIREMGLYMLTAPAIASLNIGWSVYSRVNVGVSPVTGGWVDNEFDTQRRRGLERTTRVLFGTGLG